MAECAQDYPLQYIKVQIHVAAAAHTRASLPPAYLPPMALVLDVVDATSWYSKAERTDLMTLTAVLSLASNDLRTRRTLVQIFAEISSSEVAFAVRGQRSV